MSDISNSPTEPHRICLRQIQRLDARIVQLRRRADQLSWLRLLVFSVGVTLMIATYFRYGAWSFLIFGLATLLVFVQAAQRHEYVEGLIRTLALAKRYYQFQIARLTLTWDNLPPSSVKEQVGHPYEMDLDILGDHSLMRLIDHCVTATGSQRLVEWLTQPVLQRETIEARQHIVREFKPFSTFRLKLYAAARSTLQTTAQWSDVHLLTWLAERSSAAPPLLIYGLFGLGTVNILLFLLSFTTPVWPTLRAICFGLYALLSISRLRDSQALMDNARTLAATLTQLRAVFDVIERQPFASYPALRQLTDLFHRDVTRPSHHMRQVERIVGAASIQGNQILWLLLNAAIPWDIYFASRLAHKKAEIAQLMPQWLEVWYELEALGAFANLAYLYPSYTYPLISDEAMRYEAQQIGHPLLHAEVRVTNDFSFTQSGEVVIVTGSNMSGKSTFLRTLGINLALALAGGPVCAANLTTSPFRLFTCIRVSDSVTDGFSYFYAEVQRLRELLEALKQPHDIPLLFLIDEIFKGTNNRERLLGSRAYIRALVGQYGVGMISTHDLELVRLAEELPLLHNYHFTEHIIDGRMVFDYKLRSGPSPSTNALRIMRLAGLPVDLPDEQTRE